MYGLKQAAILAYNFLVQNLSTHDYYPLPHTVGLWGHLTRSTKFCLCVDDLGIKYFKEDDANHLLDSLKHSYSVSVADFTGASFCGLTLKWNYVNGFVDIMMPTYIKDALLCFQHPKLTQPQYSPHPHTPVQFGRKGIPQLAPDDDPSPALNKIDTKYVQSVIGTLLYYARAIDVTMLPALNEIAAAQANPTTNTLKRCKRLLDYSATYPSAFVRYYASDMILSIDSDAAYLVMPQARSRIAGYFFLTTAPSSGPHPIFNGAILVECKTLRHVVASAAEAEVAGIFHNAQIALTICHLLLSLGHPQPPTSVKTDNSTAHGFLYNNINQKKSKSWDMRYYWLRDKKDHQYFHYYWAPGNVNYADYFTKHHTTRHHRENRSKYVQDTVIDLHSQFSHSSLNLLTSIDRYLPILQVRGCIGTPSTFTNTTTSTSTSICDPPKDLRAQSNIQDKWTNDI